jgi:hypothetical protein
VNRAILFLHDDDAFTSAKDYKGLSEYFRSNHFVILVKALEPHTERQGDKFTRSEMHVRDEFDWFLFKLGTFQHLIDSKLITYSEIETHLKYTLDLISGGKENTSIDLTNRLYEYADFYDFDGAKALIRQRTEARGDSQQTVLAPLATS